MRKVPTTLLLFAGIVGLGLQQGAAQNYQSGILGKWEAVSCTSNRGLNLPFPSLEIGCISNNGRVQLFGLGRGRPVNLGEISCRYYRDTPVKAWAENQTLLIGNWRGDWIFTHNLGNDLLELKLCQDPRASCNYWRFRRLTHSYPCGSSNEEGSRPSNPNHADRHQNGQRRNQESRRESSDNRLGNEQDSVMKITRIYTDGPARSNFQKLILDGQCFPMNIELWIDGEAETYFGVKWISSGRLTTTVISTGRKPKYHHFQVKNLATGELSNVYRLYY